MKNFLLGMLVMSVIASGLFYFFQPMRHGPGFGPGPGDKSLTVAEKSICGITAEVTEGPYYISNTPLLIDGNLNYDNMPGEALIITGGVYMGTGTDRPLANAIIDIRQTDTLGAYHPNANGNISNYSDAEIALRGYVTTDAVGQYVFKTIYPGEYSGRTRHIHIKVTPNGGKVLTTQLILSQAGDDISFDEDTVSQGLPSCHLLIMTRNNGVISSSFDFHLAQ